MGHGVHTAFDAVIVSGTTGSSEIDMGRAFAKVCIDPTGASGSVMFQVAPSALGSAGTYRYLKYNVASGMSAPQTVTVGSAASGSIVEVPALSGFRFVKVVTDNAMADGKTLKLLCSDY